MKHLIGRYFGKTMGFAILAFLAAGCLQRTPEATPLSLVSPSAVPLPTRTPSGATEQVPIPSPTAVCTESAGTLLVDEYRGVAVAQDIPVALYLPPCYEAETKLYTTLYLLHGYPYDHGHWVDLGVIEIADDGIGRGEWPAFIMVMPLQPEPLFRSSDGGPGSYETEMLEGLVPFIERTYRSDPSNKALAGISRGGVWALEIALRNPQEFNSLAALSPALAVNSARPPYDPFEIVFTSDRFPREILLVAGKDDWAAVETQRLSGALSDMGVEHVYFQTEGAHTNETWASVLSEVLSYIAQ